ncbi:GNAT family N-acetyltransferase [Streptomyces poonensis]|uniref:N-acetyltransferase n=1 Tax=Streptomyces poonensis TaxID=68255 RepID=A0A918UE98_9ACTN|nr:GNAT family N-acetyltransferase [Streptomyces poonensis]GGY96467.1 N-acetyltransferase [Streptomyces poonensis]GLJ88963.1 N-acetyltransferase [Streptomyces poonensis]
MDLEGVVVRAIRAEEWVRVRRLRLEALRDPVADLAFLETYGTAVTRPDSYWRERTAGAAEGERERRQFIAETAGGEWVGSVTVLLERAGTQDPFGGTVKRDQGHVVGVYVRPGYRGDGAGVTRALFDAALEWAWAAGVERVRLFVHERNGRAEAFYRKAGFVAAGVRAAAPSETGGEELEYEIKRSETSNSHEAGGSY